MSTKWVVTAAAERIVMNEERKGETTFTVTNPSEVVDRVVFDVVPDEGAGESWFSVEEPQRVVRPGASVSYLLKVAVPKDTPPGSYTMQGRVYSADSAPEESSVLSPRVVLEVPPEPEPAARRLPWWVLAAAAAALLLIVVVVVVIVATGGDEPEPVATPTPTPTPVFVAPGEVRMPDLIGMSERDALRTLAEAGLTARPIIYLHDPERPDSVITQVPPADTSVPETTVVDLEVAIALEPPTITGPAVTPVLPAANPGDPAAALTLEWSVGLAPVREWRVELFQEVCSLRWDALARQYKSDCQFLDTPSVTEEVEMPSLTPVLTVQSDITPVGVRYHSGWVRWRVSSMDDFDNAGPPSDFATFLQRTH
jgi:hypothetical protein